LGVGEIAAAPRETGCCLGLWATAKEGQGIVEHSGTDRSVAKINDNVGVCGSMFAQARYGDVSKQR
jgi:hypothetical protein